MAKKRIADIADTHGLNAKDLARQLQEAGSSVPSPNSTIEEKLALKVVDAARAAKPANHHPQRIGGVPPELQVKRLPKPENGGAQRQGGPRGQGAAGNRSAAAGNRGPGR